MLEVGLKPKKKNRYSGCSAVGSASGLGPGGRRFESCHPDENSHKVVGVFLFYPSLKKELTDQRKILGST